MPRSWKYRGRELAPVKQGSRIAVYGDSFVLAEDVDLEETFVERLGAHLSSGPPIETVNAGVKGYGPDQECLKLEREIAALAPDLVLLVLYSSNDFGDLVRNKMFRVDPEGRAVLERYTLEPALVAEFETRARGARRPALLRAYEQWIVRRPEPARSAPASTPAYIQLYLAAAQDEYSEFALERNPRVRQVWNDYYDADLAIQPESASAVFKRGLMQAVLARVQEQCARRRIPLCALVVPSAVDLCPDQIRVDPELYPSWSPARLTDALAEILRELGVPFLDLYASFLESGPERLYIGGGNMHWNAAGQELAARLTAAFLREHGLWPPPDPR